MALPTVVLSGLAQFVSVAGTITYASAAIYPLQKTIKATHDFQVEEIKDPSGFDFAWAARNEFYEITIGMYLVDGSGYTATPSGAVDNAIKGAFFPTPINTVVLSGFGGSHSADFPLLNSTFQVRPGSTIDLENLKCGEIEWKLRRYTNAAQQLAIALTPTA
jgi:hypothetical protein